MMADVIIHGQFVSFVFFFRKVTSRLRMTTPMTTPVDQGFSTNKNPFKSFDQEENSGHEMSFSLL